VNKNRRSGPEAPWSGRHRPSGTARWDGIDRYLPFPSRFAISWLPGLNKF
jgi:hypothetical protein